MMNSKQQRWHDVTERFSRMTDKLGRPIDAGIRETVIALNVLGIITRQSCEGHLDHGTGAPWVDVISTGAEILEQQVKEAFHNAQQVSEQQMVPQDQVHELYKEAHVLRRRAKAIHVETMKKLMDLLSAFYKDRQVPYDQRLVIQTGSRGNYRMESQGAELQETAPQEIRQQKLQQYQEEMQVFTDFLKETYFSEDISTSLS